MDKLKALISEYGTIAIVIYASIMVLTLACLGVAAVLGFEMGGLLAGVGTAAGVYIAYKALMPLRIALTAVLTPIVAHFWHKWRRTHVPQAKPSGISEGGGQPPPSERG